MGNVIALVRQLVESYFAVGDQTNQGSNSANFENLKGFPHVNYEIRDLVITENKIVANVVMTGAQLKKLCGLHDLEH